MSRKNATPAGNNPLKHIALVTPVLLFLLMVGAIVFYKERMLYIDAPHILFRIINDGHFWIEEHRYGSFISQILPLSGSKLHLPLMWLMILYSANFYLFYLTVSLLLFYRFREYGLTILLGLYFTLLVSSSYYWPNNEVHQGIAWLLLVFGLNFSFATKKKHLLTTVLLFILSFFFAIWTHPLVMLAAVYLWFFFMGGKEWPYSKVQSLLFSVILLTLAYVKFYQGMHHGYDSGKIETLTQFQFKNIKTVLSSPQLHFFIRNCVTHYWLFSLLFVTGLVGLAIEKKYLLLLWTLIYVGGYFILTGITFRDVLSREYLESEYMPMVIICCAPFVYYVLPKLIVRSSRLAITALVFVYVVRLVVIYNAAAPYTNRIAIMEKINEQMKLQHLTKVIIPEPTPYLDSALIMNWGAPVESIYISKLKGESPQRTFIFMPMSEVKAADTIAKDTLLGCFEKRVASRINAHYFQMDTSVAYKVLILNSKD